MEFKKELIFKLRSCTILHYSVVFVSAFIIIFIYYSYMNAIPTPPGHYMDWFWNIFYFEFRNNVIGILLNVPILYSAIILGWKRSLIIIPILLISIAPYIVNFSYRPYTLLTSFSSLIIPALIIISVEIKLISDAKERKAEAEKKKERLEFMRQLFGVQEDERKRMALELHDTVIQTILVDVSMANNILETNKVNHEIVKKDLEAIKENGLNMVTEIRSICQNLRPSVLDNLGLVSSIRWLTDTLHEDSGIDVEFSVTGQVSDLSSEKSVAVFRIVQETLNNIKKHAEASLIQVTINFSETSMSVQIKDNGKGFEVTDNINRLALSGKLGILGMNERAQSIGAFLQIKSRKGLGTETIISISMDTKAKLTQMRGVSA